MKRLLFVVLALVLIVKVGAEEHLVIKGVPINGTLKEFTEKLIAKGCEEHFVNDKDITVKGDFAGYKNCRIKACAPANSDMVNTVEVLFPRQNTWEELYKNYITIKDMLEDKYGAPSSMREKFELSYTPGNDAARLQAVLNHRCKYMTVFETKLGKIVVSIHPKSYVVLEYTDYTNHEESRAAAMDDL